MTLLRKGEEWMLEYPSTARYVVSYYLYILMPGSLH